MKREKVGVHMAYVHRNLTILRTGTRFYFVEIFFYLTQPNGFLISMIIERYDHRVALQLKQLHRCCVWLRFVDS